MTFLRYLRNRSKRNNKRGAVARILSKAGSGRPSRKHTLARWRTYANKIGLNDEGHDIMDALWSDYEEKNRVAKCASCGTEFNPSAPWKTVCSHCYASKKRENEERTLAAAELSASAYTIIATALSRIADEMEDRADIKTSTKYTRCQPCMKK